MNIAELRQAPPGTKQYLDAQLLAIGPAKAVTTQRGLRYVEELQVVDRQGVKEKIGYWYDADKPDFAMPVQQINQWILWNVTTKPKGQYLNISGYPEKQTQQAPPAQQGYNPPPQAQPQEQSYSPPSQVLPQGPAGPEPPRQVPVQQPVQQPPQAPPQKQTFQQQVTAEDYKQAERTKVLGMCFTNLLSARLAIIPATEIIDDIAELQALSKLSAICIDGVGGQPNPEYSENPDPPEPGDKF